MPLASGARLGLYEVRGLSGAGGMGEVYKARDTRLDRAVALMLHPAHIRTLHDVGERDLARFSGRCRTSRPSNSRGSRRMRRPTASMTCNVRAAGRVQAWVVDPP